MFSTLDSSAADYEKAVAAQNSLIESILISDEPDTEILFSLVADRDELVNQCLRITALVLAVIIEN